MVVEEGLEYGPAKRRAWDGPLSGAASEASQALRTARYTALDMVRICPSVGTTNEVRAAMADKRAQDQLLRSWADLAAGWARKETLRQLEDLAANRLELP